MTLADDIALFSRIALFQSFAPEQLRLLAFGSKRRFFWAEEAVYHAGDPSDGGYVIISGQIDLVIEKNGRTSLLSSHLENSLIGELSLITDNNRIATAVARTNCELLFVPREAFRRMLAEFPELAELLQQRITASVNFMITEMEQVLGKLEQNPGFEGLDIGFGSDNNHA